MPGNYSLLNSCTYFCSIEFLYLPFFHWVLVFTMLSLSSRFKFTVLSLNFCVYYSFIEFLYFFAFLNDKIQTWRAYLKNKLQISWRALRERSLGEEHLESDPLEKIPWRQSLGEVSKTYLGWTNQLKITRYIISRAKTPFRWRSILSIFTNQSCNLMLYFEILQIKQVYLHFK